MAVTIRLQRHGAKKRPFYRMVVTDKENRRDGRFIEVLGTYNPMVDPPVVELKKERIEYWVGVGAQTSKLAKDILNKQLPGLLEEREKRQREKIRAKRKARKERAKQRAA